MIAIQSWVTIYPEPKAIKKEFSPDSYIKLIRLGDQDNSKSLNQEEVNDLSQDLRSQLKMLQVLDSVFGRFLGNRLKQRMSQVKTQLEQVNTMRDNYAYFAEENKAFANPRFFPPRPGWGDITANSIKKLATKDGNARTISTADLVPPENAIPVPPPEITPVDPVPPTDPQPVPVDSTPSPGNSDPFSFNAGNVKGTVLLAANGTTEYIDGQSITIATKAQLQTLLSNLQTGANISSLVIQQRIKILELLLQNFDKLKTEENGREGVSLTTLDQVMSRDGDSDTLTNTDLQ